MTCTACNAALLGNYCANCGEKRFDPHALSLRHFLEHSFEAFAHFDGTIFRTLYDLILQPGKLTVEYARGCRKPYLAPVQLFVLMNVLYFAATAINGWNTLNTDLNTHRNYTDHQELARGMVDAKLAGRGVSLADYQLVFDAKSGIQAKSLVLLMVPVFAFGVAIVRLWQRRYFVEHLVFSVHYYAFLLFFLAVATSLTKLILDALRIWGGIKPSVPEIDAWTSLVSAVILAVYLTAALRATGVRSWPWAIALGLLLLWLSFKILQGYRLLLFFVGFYTT